MESFFNDPSSDSDDGECVPNMPSSRASPACHSPYHGMVVPDTPESVWTTLEYEKIKKQRSKLRLFGRGELDIRVPCKEMEDHPDDDLKSYFSAEETQILDDSYVCGSQETQLPPCYVPSLCDEMLKLLVPSYFEKKTS